MNIILIPGKVGLDEGFYLASRKASKGTNTLIRVDLQKAENLVRVNKVNNVVILAGAKYKGKIISPYQAYQALHRLNKRLRITIIDGWKWPVRHQYMIPVKDPVGLVRKLLK